MLKCFCERSNESRRLYRVTLLKDGKRACATALYDTGNLLKKQPQQIPVHIGGSALFDIVGEDASFLMCRTRAWEMMVGALKCVNLMR